MKHTSHLYDLIHLLFGDVSGPDVSGTFRNDPEECTRRLKSTQTDLEQLVSVMEASHPVLVSDQDVWRP